VFYSPSIVTGVDFSIDGEQKVYLYREGRSINVLDSYQQATRTRNIDQLIYFIKDKKSVSTWNNLETITEKNLNVKNLSDKMLNMCTTINEFDEVVLNENAYFNIASNNEYVNGILACDPVHYFELILKANGFIVSQVNKTQVLSKEAVKEQKTLIKI
jgi:hypothetical protein